MVRLRLLTVCLIAFATVATAQVTESDVLGVYFDAAYTTNDMVTPTLPHLQTAYLVLHNPTQTAGGIGGWECRIDMTNYQPMVQWHLVGGAVNYETPPEFVVGYTDALPVTGPDVLLATFDMWIDEDTPMEIQLTPNRQHPSIPDAMAYIPWDDKELLTPMTTVTGRPGVANINWTPLCETNRGSWYFDEVVMGYPVTEQVRVTNIGGGVLTVDPVLITDDDYTITAPVGPVDLAAGEFVEISVLFDPTFEGGHSAQLDYGPNCAPIWISGHGVAPVLDYYVSPDSIDFGAVLIGVTSERTMYIRNDGNVILELVPETPCPDFGIIGDPVTLEFGEYVYYTVTFTPQTLGALACAMILGPGLDTVPLTGLGGDVEDLLSPFPAVMDWGEVLPGESVRATLRVHNGSSVIQNVVPRLDDPDGVFRLTGEGQARTLYANSNAYFYIYYEPDHAGADTGSFYFEDLDFNVPLHGIGIDIHEGVIVEPTVVDFGTVAVLAAVDTTLIVTNDSLEEAVLTPEVYPPTGHFQIVVGGDPVTVPPLATHTIVVRLQPQSAGEILADLRLGTGNPVVPMSAWAFEIEDDLLVEPVALDFGAWLIGSYVERDVRLNNLGDTPVAVAPQLLPPGEPFNLTAGSNLTVVPPHETSIVTVRFLPTETGTFATTLDLGVNVFPVPVTGQGDPGVPECRLSESTIEFLPTAVGQSSSRRLTITNTGTASIFIEPEATCSDFRVLTGQFLLGPGGEGVVVTLFQPTSTGDHTCRLDLGDDACEDPVLTGDAFNGTPVGVWYDLAGIYFDEDYYEPYILDVQENDVFEAYLVLHEPYSPEDITGWEFRLLMGDELTLLDVQYEGGGLNYSNLPEFTVGLTNPLIAMSTMRLATFTFMATSEPDDAPIAIVPKHMPSIPDHMALISGPEHVLRPLYSATGGPVVAWVNYFDPSVGNDDPVDEPELPDAPQATRLLPNVPNPFNPETAIRYEVAREGRVRIDVFDVMGRRVATLLDEVRGVGADQVVWQGRDDRGRSLPSGAYYVRLETIGLVDTRKVMLLK